MALSHPPYFHMISEAISTMKDRTGSSQPAIAKFIEENYAKSLPTNFRKILSTQLKRLVESEKLFKVKSSYKISATEKPRKPSNSPAQKRTANAVGIKPAKKRPTAKITASKAEPVRKTAEKAKKTKRLSEVKTPEAMKKKKTKERKRKAGPTAKAGSTPPAKKGKDRR